MVDELVASDGMHPGRKGFAGLISMPVAVDGQECFLHQVLRVRGGSAGTRKPAREVCPQMPAEPIKQRAIGRAIPAETGKHQGLEVGFGGRHRWSSMPFGQRHWLVTPHLT